MLHIISEIARSSLYLFVRHALSANLLQSNQCCGSLLVRMGIFTLSTLSLRSAGTCGVAGGGGGG
jgi:hypothetical protein